MTQTEVDNTVRQTLRGVLASSDKADPELRACFYREQVLREHLRERDHELYEAHRDVVRPKDTAGFDGSWRVDRVRYPGVDLPSGELNRSTGHWNPADQWEIFEVEHGEVVLLTRMPGPDEPVELHHCEPGSVVVLAPGAWHLTCAPAGPAVVSNAYTSGTRGSHTGKYFTRRPTVRCGLRRDGTGFAVYQDGDDRVLRRTAWPRQTVLPGLPTLSVLFGDEHDPAAVARFEEYCTGAGRP